MPFPHLFRSKEKSDCSDRQPVAAPPELIEAAARPAAAPGPETASVPETMRSDGEAGSFYEKDNRAGRVRRLSQAQEFWDEYEKRRPGVPFLRYVFDTELQAIEALLSVTCIHQAADTGHLLCTEPITMGCYRMIDGRYEVFLAGKELSYRTWSEATEKFSSHQGRYRDQLKPDPAGWSKDRALASAQVVFKKDYYQIDLHETQYYQVFEAPSTQAAWAFLLLHENMITAGNRFILVETPAGTVCRDMSGIHEISP